MDKENNSVFSIKRKIIRKMNWSDDEIQCLIYFWRENYEDLTRTKRNRIIYDLIAANLHEHGYQRTSDEIQKKISNLSTKYKDEKTACSKTGSSPSRWPYYQMLNEFLCKNPLHDPSQLRESHIPHCSTSGSLQSTQEDRLQQSNSQSTDVINYMESVTLNQPMFSNVEKGNEISLSQASSCNVEKGNEISLSQASSCRNTEDHDYLEILAASQQSNSNIPSDSITETPKQGNKRTKESSGTSSGEKKKLSYEERMLQCLENTADLILKNQERIIGVMETQNAILKRMFPE